MANRKFDLQISETNGIKQIWFVLGIILTGLGIVGYLLPIMPGTTFVILALYCFARSNEKMHTWLLHNKYFGKTLNDFKQGRGMSIKAKITAIACIAMSISTSMYFASNMYVHIFLAICAIVAIMCVLWQKTKH